VTTQLSWHGFLAKKTIQIGIVHNDTLTGRGGNNPCRNLCTDISIGRGGNNLYRMAYTDISGHGGKTRHHIPCIDFLAGGERSALFRIDNIGISFGHGNNGCGHIIYNGAFAGDEGTGQFRSPYTDTFGGHEDTGQFRSRIFLIQT
jgi:hypothetical protein